MKLNRLRLFKKSTHAKQTKLSVGKTLDHYGIFELCQPTPTQPPCFAIKKKDAPIQYANETSDNIYNYQPYAKVPWTLPTQPQQYRSQEELWNEVKQCIYEHVDLPEETAYDILTAWIFASWLLEKWQIAPYLFFFGTFATGKTRALEVLSRLCMRGWLALYITPANLYRPLENWKPCLFLDEAEIYGDKHETLGLLNGSYRKGQYVARQREMLEEKDYETVFFDCFAFKAIAGTRELAKTLQSRCVIFRTSQATRKIRFFINENQCTQLRNKLLKWRFDKMLTEGTEGTEGSPERCEQLVEEIGSQREVELFYPLISVAPTKEIEQTLIQYAKTSASRKLEELSLTTEAMCLSAILQGKERELVQNGRLYIREITKIVNEGLTFDEYWKERFTSSVCARLGFQKSRGAQGRAVILWNDKLIERLKKDKRYASCFTPPPSETPSVSSVPSVEEWKDALKT
jgi:hypothetical protein